MTTPLGKYRLVKLIAAGGMAEVYLARQAGAAGFEKQVCLKRILPHLARDKQFVDMFLNEARLAARLDHPNIVSIFDLGESNGNYFIAMEFIDGPNLRSVAKRAAELNELLPIAEVLKIVAQAAGGLQYAHDLTDPQGRPLGLVHRDISPDNILVHRNGTVKVVDFGIAKAAGSSGGTRTGTLKGKVAYMPPEQLRGEALDRRVDVFALGVVLYELLSGHRPWDASSEVALIGRIMTEEPQPLLELRDDVLPELWRIVEKALAKNRDERHQTCNELQADLEQLIVSLGQSITSSRVADFVRAYSPQEEAPNEGTGAELAALQDEAFGTGAAPAILATPAGFAGAHAGESATDAGTVALNGAIAPQRKSRAVLHGAGAFAAIVLVGGLGWFWLRSSPAEDAQPVAVERAAANEAKAPAAASPAAPAQAAAAYDPATQAQPAPAKVEAQPPAAAPPTAASKASPSEAAPEQAAPPQQPPAPARGKSDRLARLAQVQPSSAPVSQQPAQQQEPAQAPPAVVVQEASPAGPSPAPATAPAPPVIVAKGELVLFVRPWAKVEVDGNLVGETPLPAALKLAVGDHQVRLINPDLNKDVTRTVHISASEREVLKEILDE
jgi:serine/threonine-protein kinase